MDADPLQALINDAKMHAGGDANANFIFAYCPSLEEALADGKRMALYTVALWINDGRLPEEQRETALVAYSAAYAEVVRCGCR